MTANLLDTGSANCHQQAYQFLIKGKYGKAASLYEEAIQAQPDVKSNYWHLGLTMLLQGQEEEAHTTWLLGMVEGEPEQVEQWTEELVRVLQAEAQRREALAEESVAWLIRQHIRELQPQNINNLLHLVQLAIKLERFEGDELKDWGVLELLQAEQLPDLDPDLLLQTLRNVLESTPLHPLALELAEACFPHLHQFQAFRNVLLVAAVEVGLAKRQHDIGIPLAELCLKADPEETEILLHLAALYQNARKYDAGIETAKVCYYRQQDLPNRIYANHLILRGLMSAGAYWEEVRSIMERQESDVLSLIEQQPTELHRATLSRLLNSTFFFPYLRDLPQQNRKIQNQMAQFCQTQILSQIKELPEKYREGLLRRKQTGTLAKPLKIGYVSHCMRMHSVGWLARWLIEHHDRERFQIYGYFVSYTPSSDPIQSWYVSTVGQARQFGMDSGEIAEGIYQDEIDILVDLDSITLDTTCEVMMLKPAPVQVTWLGWDAVGLPTVDYFLADPYVLPESAEDYYAEKIWRLPQTYIAVDGFEVGAPTLRRDDLDIRSDAVVYFSGQRGYKRNPDTIRLQMKILKGVPNSYFLIKGDSDKEAIKKLFTQIAEEEGVDAGRLRFLQEVGTEPVHRANLGIADVVLDTYPYNGATTTMETLWMCVPMVTRVGEQFSARNSYTMMVNAGVTEGIAWSDEEYVEWGIRLGLDPALRQQVSWKLRQGRQTAPLWNGKQFTREMEKAYEQMWQRYLEAS